MTTNREISKSAAAMGRKGGAAATDAQKSAARRNGALGGRPPRMRLAMDDVGRVSITYRDHSLLGDGREVTRRITCPVNGGYVHEIMPSGDTAQLCEGLGHGGTTLICGSRDELPALVRREWTRYQRALRRDQ